MKGKPYSAIAALTILAAAACNFAWPRAALAANSAPMLAGKVTSSTGESLTGIPIKAHRDNSAVTIAVYTDITGGYSFPSWSDLTSGSYTVGVELPDFVHVSQHVTISQGKPATIDFTLQSKPLAYEDATAAEIIAALPGDDRQKVLFSQCSNCHTLQWALRTARTKEDWISVVTQMAGRDAKQEAPGSYAFSQKQFIELLAEYLASIRGPGSSDKIPFKQLPRPTDAASTKLVVTEYALPRGGQRELYLLRGDPRFVWPHDVIMNDKYAYYTDHFSYVLGRLDLNTGKAVEMPFTNPHGSGRSTAQSDGRPGNPGGGAHELQFDSHGDVIIGMANGTVKYDPEAGTFKGWAVGHNMFGLDPQGNDWFEAKNGVLSRLDTNTGEVKDFSIPKNKGIYDTDTDFKGRTDLYIWRDSKIGVFDPSGEEYAAYQTPTPMSGPRRGQIDDQNRLWAGEFFAGQILMFDNSTKAMKEYPLLPGVKPYKEPYAEPYTASVDSKHGIVWTHDFSSDRLYRIDIKTGESTQYMTPSNYEVRDLKVDTAAPRPTVWLPAYRPPSKLVKIQLPD